MKRQLWMEGPGVLLASLPERQDKGWIGKGLNYHGPTAMDGKAGL